MRYDFVIVGSGPSGVSAAFPLLEAGCSVLMVDGGKRPRIPPPQAPYLQQRRSDDLQWKWMVGADFHGLRQQDAVSPKLRVPGHAFAFEGFETENRIAGRGVATVGSLAVGGLSNAWGCGVARFSPAEMQDYPFPHSDLDASFRAVARRVGISGRAEDDLADCLGVDEHAQGPLPLDGLHAGIWERYPKRRQRLLDSGFRLGRSRVAALSEDVPGRQGCNLSGNCLWGCARHALYSSTDEIETLSRFARFTSLSGLLVQRISQCEGGWAVHGMWSEGGGAQTIRARRVIMAAGTLATSRIVFSALDYRRPRRLLSCPIAAFLVWLPRHLGAARVSGFGYGQLSFRLALAQDEAAFGSTFATTGIPIAEFARHLPLRRRGGIALLRELLSSCIVGNLFLSGDRSALEVELGRDDTLAVRGEYGPAVAPLMRQAASKLTRAYATLGGLVLPGSFRIGRPGGDIHYAGTLPMRRSPGRGDTTWRGEAVGLEGVFVVDGACLPTLPGKSHTLMIMANSDRIGRLLADEARMQKQSYS